MWWIAAALASELGVCEEGVVLLQSPPVFMQMSAGEHAEERAPPEMVVDTLSSDAPVDPFEKPAPVETPVDTLHSDTPVAGTLLLASHEAALPLVVTPATPATPKQAAALEEAPDRLPSDESWGGPDLVRSDAQPWAPATLPVDGVDALLRDEDHEDAVRPPPQGKAPLALPQRGANETSARFNASALRPLFDNASRLGGRGTVHLVLPSAGTVRAGSVALTELEESAWSEPARSEEEQSEAEKATEEDMGLDQKLPHEGKSAVREKPAPRECDTCPHGICHDGACFCRYPYYGPQCEHSTRLVPSAWAWLALGAVSLCGCGGAVLLYSLQKRVLELKQREEAPHMADEEWVNPESESEEEAGLRGAVSHVTSFASAALAATAANRFSASLEKKASGVSRTVAGTGSPQSPSNARGGLQS